MVLRSGSVSGLQSNPPSGFTRVTNIFTVDFTADLGTVALLTGLTATQTVTGLLTTDQVIVQCISALPAGVGFGGARVSAANTLSLRFTTIAATGTALGSLSYRVTIFR